MVNLDEKDQFGVPWRDSIVPDYELVELIHSLGLTADQASEMRHQGNLPVFVLRAWDEYDKLNKARFGRHGVKI